MFKYDLSTRLSLAVSHVAPAVFIYGEAGSRFPLFTGEPDPSGNGETIG